MGTKDFQRPFSMRGITTKIKTPHGSMFVTINFFEAQMKEIFVVVSKPGSEVRACAEALGRVISLALQKGVSPEDIAETLENLKTEEVSWNRIDGKSFPVSSIPDGISKVIRFALSLKNTPDVIRISESKGTANGRSGSSTGKTGVEKVEAVKHNPGADSEQRSGQVDDQEDSRPFSICPKCHLKSLTFQEGCYLCVNCGYTKCS